MPNALGVYDIVDDMSVVTRHCFFLLNTTTCVTTPSLCDPKDFALYNISKKTPVTG